MNTLKEVGQISPRLNNFIVDLRQEEIYRGWSVGLRNPDPALLTLAPSVRPKTRLDATFLSEELKVDKRSKKVTCVGPAQI